MLNLAMKTRYLMERQAQTGIRFDVEKAKELVVFIEQKMQELADEVEPQLPMRQLKKSEEAGYKFPKKCFNADGSYSVLLERFIEKHGLVVSDGRYQYGGEWHPIVGDTYLPAEMPMKLGESDDLKEWLLSIGWQPTMWNLKKDKRGKPVRGEDGKLIVTSPKIHDKGKICENLDSLGVGCIPSIVLWFSYRHRLGQLSSWLDSSRLHVDGRLTSGSSGITNTFRQKHTGVVNVPKAEEGVLLGKEFRSLFIADEGMVLVGYDASALEGRVTGHYTAKYDNGLYAKELLEGDVHSKNARVFYPEETKNLENGSPEFKPYRSTSKNGLYALTYGCSPKKLAETLRRPLNQGDELYQTFWDNNPALAKLRDDVIAYGKKHKHLLAIDGRKLYGRSEHSWINLVFQSCGAIIMDLSGCFMDQWLGGEMFLDDKGLPSYNYKGHIVRRVGYFHDEYLWECPPEIAEEIAELGVKSIVKAGEFFKLRIPLAGEAKIGLNWSEVH